MDGNATGLEERGFVREHVRAVRGVAFERRAEDRSSNALGRLRRGQRGPVDRRLHPTGGDPLDRLTDGHHRDGRAVDGGRRRNALDQLRRDDRSGAVVHEDDASVVIGGPSAVQAIELGQAGGDRSLAAIPAGHHRDHLGGQPRGIPDRLDPIRRGDDDEPRDQRGAGERVERPGEQRAAVDRRCQLVDAAHPDRGAGRNDDRVRSLRGRVEAHVSPAGAGRRSSARRRSAGRASRTRRGPCRYAVRPPR